MMELYELSQDIYRREWGNRHVPTPQPATRTVTRTITTPAHDATYRVAGGDTLIGIAQKYGTSWQDIYNANRGTIDSDPRVGRLPSRSPGWWIFPGQDLRIPGGVPASTRTVTERVTVPLERGYTMPKITYPSYSYSPSYSPSSSSSYSTSNTKTQRFTTTSVHKYEYHTVTRDTELAYFAGIREVRAFTANPLEASDKPFFEILKYTGNEFEFSQAFVTSDSGALTNLESDRPGSVLSKTFPTITRFRRATIQSVQRPMQHEEWVDGFVSEGKVSNEKLQLDGHDLIKITSETGVEVHSPNFELPNEGYFSVGVSFQCPETVGDWVLYAEDDHKNKLFEAKISSEGPGVWSTITTQLWPTKRKYPNVHLVLKSSAKIVFLSKMFVDYTTIRYELSNDDGKTWVEATYVVNQPDGEVIFPNLGNKLRWRVYLGQSTDYVFSTRVTPIYYIEDTKKPSIIPSSK